MAANNDEIMLKVNFSRAFMGLVWNWTADRLGDWTRWGRWLRGICLFWAIYAEEFSLKEGAQTANRFGTTLPTFAGDLLALRGKCGLRQRLLSLSILRKVSMRRLGLFLAN
ncbi:MAG: hypothetical protein ACTS4Y_01170 [Candidatus Hodgkinia cicadicola]